MKVHYMYNSQKYNTYKSFSVLRDCLSKNHPLNLAQKIILPETLPT